ncbi:Uncharacterised protein [Yersinia enterocolitica]|nr:Uncharacterised protein [Yersinia enterocolitica]
MTKQELDHSKILGFLVDQVWSAPTTIDISGPQPGGPQITVTSVTVVERFNVIEDICLSQLPGFVDPFSDALFF